MGINSPALFLRCLSYTIFLLLRLQIYCHQTMCICTWVHYILGAVALNVEQGWRGVDSARLSPMCHTGAEFVVGFCLAVRLEGFFSSYSGFPPFTKTNISKFEID